MAQWLRELAVGDWYDAQGNLFEVVGMDAAAEVVLVQYFDGSLDEIEFDEWIELSATPCAPPEDFSGALDLDRDDLRIDEPSLQAPDSALKRLGTHDLY